MDSAPAKRRKLVHAESSADNALRSASTTGLFALEAEELLEQVALNYPDDSSGADDFPGTKAILGEIKTSIEAIEPHELLPLVEAARQLKKKHRLEVPFPDPAPAKDCNYKVAFTKITEFNVVGSYVSQTMVKTQKDRAIDMIFTIPAELLQEKDYLDLRYFYKRAYILAVVSASLKEKFGSDADLSFEYLNGNPLCPVLALRPKNKGQDLDYRIRVIPCSPDSVFPKAKLHLGATLVRKAEDKAATSSSKPTPFYNSTLVAEASFKSYLKLIRLAEKKCAAFKDACILGRIWLQQRGLGGAISDGGFGHFEWAALLALLLRGGGAGGQRSGLSTSLKSAELFKGVIQFLATAFSTQRCVLGSANAEPKASPDSGPVIFDSERQLNIAFKMSPWSASLLHQHARWTRSLIVSGAADQFSATFILKADSPLHSFDLVAKLQSAGSFDYTAEVDSRGRAWQFGSKVYRILKRALQDETLGERARMIYVRTPEAPSWQLAQKCKPQDISDVEIGILFHPTNMARTVDRGPPVGDSPEEKEECEKFLRFWGPKKAELRRFEGDTIRESLVWSSGLPMSSFEVCQEVMRHILPLHLRIEKSDITFSGNQLQDILQLKPTDSTVFAEAKKAFARFEKDLRELEDLPLHVRRLAPICPELRHASVKLPSLQPSKSVAKQLPAAKSGPVPMETVISFEASGKWPENIAAIQRTKIAFLLMIGSLLESGKEGGVRTLVGLEDVKSETENLAFLDVIYEPGETTAGASFRLRIHSDLEEVLLDRQVKDKTQEQHVRTNATALLASFRRLHTHLPLHSQTISTNITQFPALSPTIRLLKHWFSSHKLSSHFLPELIELIALNVFLSPYPWDAPSSANTGFFRALLFLARWDWRTDPFIAGDLSPADKTAIANRFEAWRKIDPMMNHTVLFAATPHDNTGLAYTSSSGHAMPSKVVATRMTLLAKSAYRVVREEGLSLDPRKLFVPSLKDYDVVIRLNSKVAKSALKTYPTNSLEDEPHERHSKFKNLDERTGKDMLPLAQHPSEALLKHLSMAYGGALVFFKGAPEDMTVGAIWNPQVERKKFRVNLPASYKPGVEQNEDMDVDDNGEEQGVDVDLNKEGILAEIARIGGDLIEKIEAKGL